MPPARLGALLVARRTESGLDLAEVAQRSGGLFTPSFLDEVERGRASVDDEIMNHLVGLYEVAAGPVVPQRSELVLDLDRHEISVGDNAVAIDSLHADDVLERYVSLVYLLRGAQPGTDLVLRDADLDILATSLGYSPADVRSQVNGLIAAPASVQRAKRVRTRTIIAGVGLAVTMAVVASLVLVGVSRSEPTQVLGVAQPLATTSLPVQLGAAAEATIDFDFRAALPDWQIIYTDPEPGLLGLTVEDARTITVHIGADATTASVAGVLMHEVGHAIDLETDDNAMRMRWIELRSIPATWWPGNGLSDFAVGAGDFAEAVAAVTTGSPSRSVYGEFTDEQLAFVADVLAAT